MLIKLPLKSVCPGFGKEYQNFSFSKTGITNRVIISKFLRRWKIHFLTSPTYAWVDGLLIQTNPDLQKCLG